MMERAGYELPDLDERKWKVGLTTEDNGLDMESWLDNWQIRDPKLGCFWMKCLYDFWMVKIIIKHILSINIYISSMSILHVQ